MLVNFKTKRLPDPQTSRTAPMTNSPSDITYNQNIKPAMLKPDKYRTVGAGNVSGIFVSGLYLQPQYVTCHIEPMKSIAQQEPNKVDGKFAWGYYLLPPVIVKLERKPHSGKGERS